MYVFFSCKKLKKVVFLFEISNSADDNHDYVSFTYVEIRTTV